MSKRADSQAKLDHRVYKAWIEALFRDALNKNSAWCDSLTADSNGDDIKRFARYVRRVVPVMVIESVIPYAEHLVVELLREHGYFKSPVFLLSLLTGDWQSSSGRPLDARTPLVLSFHEPNEWNESLELVHDIETTDNPVLIGCDHISQVPAEYHRLVDIQLTLSSANGEQFSQIFETLFERPLPDRNDNDRWQDFVVPTDIQPPLILHYTPADAATYIRERVTDRLSRMDVSDAPTLNELHGLGEAREIALDLKQDMHLAMQGRLNWDEVDRGLLLVGPPGTGKTTLAKAIGAIAA